jgi:hypothetical protein
MPERVVVITSRVVAGVVGLAVGAATIAAAALLPLSSIQLSPQSVSVTPQPAAKQLVCPGAVLQLGDAGGQNASVASAIGQPVTTIVATSGGYDTASLRQTDADPDAAGAPQLVTAPASTENAASIAGAQYQSVDRDDYRGLAAAACASPSSDTWLVGGSTAVGRTTLLTLANPGAVESTVSIDMFSEQGAVEASGLSGIIVPASSQRVVSLAGFGPGLASIALHVTSRGGPVAASLQQAIVRGIEASGVDVIGATSAPNTHSIIPGVVILESEEVAGRLGEQGFDDLRSALRIFVPGDAAAQVSVRVIPDSVDAPVADADGDSLTGASFDLVADPGVVTDIPIESLVDGSYSVVVDSSVPVVTAMRASTVAATTVGSVPAGASDVAWFSAATALGDSAFAAVAPGPGASLHLVNPGEIAAAVSIDGDTVTVPAGSSVTVPVSEGESLTLGGVEGLFASVSLRAPGRLASYLLASAAITEAPVTLYRG